MRVAVVTPWFPSAVSPYSGTFVREWVRAMVLDPDHVTVVHCLDVPANEHFPVERETYGWGNLIRIPVAHDPMLSRADTAIRHREELRAHASEALDAADVIHAHVGMPSGVAVAALLQDRQRLVTIEHATYLPTLLAHPVANAAYRDVVDRTTAHLVVGEDTARMVRLAFPELRDRVVTAGNPVDVSVFAPATGPSSLETEPEVTKNRWLFVGNFIERKGVLTLLESFALACQRHPDSGLTLTMVGGGPLEERLRAAVAEYGLQHRVEFVGPRSGDEVAALMRSHGTLVHLSQFETFGLTVVEAIAAGSRVIATACAGPEETLRGAVAANRAALVPLTATAADVVDAWTSLVAQPGDAAAARQSIVDAYGATGFGERLVRVSRGEDWHVEGPSRARILITAATGAGEHAVRYAVPELIGRDCDVTVVVGGRAEEVMTDPRATVVNVQSQVGGTLTARAETWFLDAAPAWTVGVTARTFAGVGAAFPAAQRVSSAAHRLVTRFGKGWERRRTPRRAQMRARTLASPALRDGVVAHVSQTVHGHGIDLVVWADRDNRVLAEHLGEKISAPVIGLSDVDHWTPEH
ncbi:glycosyltransferase [Demequina sp. B12]|uniref:glycosyltransferase n=1 Tax=Demequina sp. B12 TaxID=2992757 RepID=UPI00237A8C24|nr:glycosyltransferase [Demequina sp. B12]MDE0572316.1 glycosyltransferase [Demequina sp. B12]